jgi:hypothetical protein
MVMESGTITGYIRATMKKLRNSAILILGGIAVVWTILTVWVERAGPGSTWTAGDAAAERTALIVFDPDPKYNLDDQVCRAFAEGLAANGFYSTVATVASAEAMKDRSFDLLVFCANTYNWRPDRAVSAHIEDHPGLQGKDVVAITLGSGSTGSSQGVLESLIRDKKAILIGSRSFWLLRPNDETRMEEKNVDVAVDLAREWGGSVGKELAHNEVEK